MAYQSVFTNGQLNAGLKTSFNYVPPTPVAPKFNLNSVKDVPTLNSALHAGQINPTQWMQQFKTIQATAKGYNIPQTVGAPKILTGLKALPSVVNEQDIQPVKNTLVGAVNQAKSQVKYLAGPTASAAQRSSIINNQTAAQTNPEYLKAIQGLNLANNSAGGHIKAQQLAASGAKAPQIRAFLQKDAQALSAQTGRGLNTIATVSAFSAPGEGVLAKTAAKTGLTDALSAAKGTVAATLGKDEATNVLVNSAKATQVSKAATLADRLGNPAVQEAKTQHIPVIAPTETQGARQAVGSTAVANADRTSIPVTGKSTQVAGKVTTSSDNAYIKASNSLSDQYEKELSQVKTAPNPVAQQVLQRNLDTKYNALQQNLDDQYGKTSISFKGKSAVVKESNTALPKSALDKNLVTPFNSTRIPVAETEPKVETATASASKEPTTAPTSVTEPNTGSKVSGSSIRTQAKAVEAGMKSEAENTGATYNTVSHKAEAQKAAQLVQDNPEKAQAIAMGARGDNASHEAAVYHAVANQALEDAKKTGDYSKVTALANSPRHTGVSEAAQKLSAEGYNTNPHDPINIMNDIAKTRQDVLAKTKKVSVPKEVKNISKEVKNLAPKISRQDWHSFIQELQCK